MEDILRDEMRVKMMLAIFTFFPVIASNPARGPCDLGPAPWDLNAPQSDARALLDGTCYPTTISSATLQSCFHRALINPLLV